MHYAGIMMMRMLMLMPSQICIVAQFEYYFPFQKSVAVGFFDTGQLSESPFLIHPKDSHTAGFYQVPDVG